MFKNINYFDDIFEFVKSKNNTIHFKNQYKWNNILATSFDNIPKNKFFCIKSNNPIKTNIIISKNYNIKKGRS